MIFLFQRHMHAYSNIPTVITKPPYKNRRDLLIIELAKMTLNRFNIEDDYVVLTPFETPEDFLNGVPIKSTSKKIPLLGQYYHLDKRNMFNFQVKIEFIHSCVIDEERDFPEKNMIVADYDSMIEYSYRQEITKDNLDMKSMLYIKKRKERVKFLPYEFEYFFGVNKGIDIYKKLCQRMREEIMSSLVIIPINYVPPPPHIDKND